MKPTREAPLWLLIDSDLISLLRFVLLSQTFVGIILQSFLQLNVAVYFPTENVVLLDFA